MNFKGPRLLPQSSFSDLGTPHPTPFKSNNKTYITCIFLKPHSLAPPLASSASYLVGQENKRVLNVSFITTGCLLSLPGSSMRIATIHKLQSKTKKCVYKVILLFLYVGSFFPSFLLIWDKDSK